MKHFDFIHFSVLDWIPPSLVKFKWNMKTSNADSSNLHEVKTLTIKIRVLNMKAKKLLNGKKI